VALDRLAQQIRKRQLCVLAATMIDEVVADQLAPPELFIQLLNQQ
jgi:hypothetical protein